MCNEIVNSSNSLKRPPLLSNVLLPSQDHASLIEESPNLKLVFPTTIVLRVPSVSCWRQCGLFLASERVAGDLRCCGSILGSSLPVLRHQRQHRFCDVTPRAAATRSSLGFRIGGGRVGRPSRALLVARGRPRLVDSDLLPTSQLNKNRLAHRAPAGGAEYLHVCDSHVGTS